MSHLIRSSIEWKSRQRERFAAETVHYKRGEAAIALPASRARSQFDDVGGTGIGASIETDDFIIRVDRLEIDGQLTEPQPGDQIIVGDLDDGEVFEVRPRSGIPAWRYATNHRIEFRIHTNYVGTQPPAV